MNEIEKLRIEISALRALVEEILFQQWNVQNQDPNWFNYLRINCSARLKEQMVNHPLLDEMNKEMIDISVKAASIRPGS